MKIEVRPYSATIVESPTEELTDLVDVISYVLQTYDLNLDLKRRIREIALKNIPKFSFKSFEDRYDYISYLVDCYSSPFQEQLLLSLDAPATFDSDTPRIELIGEVDPRIQAFEEIEYSNSHSLINMSDLIHSLEGRLDQAVSNLLLSIASSDDNWMVGINPDEANIDVIESAGKELLRVFERNGRLCMPARPIKRISFNPLTIVYRHRDFNGNPLAFFQNYRDTYGQFRRSELYFFDQSLYKALQRAGQLDQAIPDVIVGKEPFWKREGYESALHYFQSHADIYTGLTRTGLRREDPRLYRALLRERSLNLAIVEDHSDRFLPGWKSNGYRGASSPLEFFKNNVDLYRDLSRNDLKKIDPSLYYALLRNGMLNEAIPEIKRFRSGPKKYRGYDVPKELVLANLDVYSGLSRHQLLAQDAPLYHALWRRNLLDELFPNR